MGEICKHFEKEDEGAADKESTFERIMDLMQQVRSAPPLCIWSNEVINIDWYDGIAF